MLYWYYLCQLCHQEIYRSHSIFFFPSYKVAPVYVTVIVYYLCCSLLFLILLFAKYIYYLFPSYIPRTVFHFLLKTITVCVTTLIVKIQCYINILCVKCVIKTLDTLHIAVVNRIFVCVIFCH